VRRRWHELVIVLSIVALAAVGVWAIWGDDIARLFQATSAPVEIAQ
jgi:hypothetical protein